MYYSDLVNRKKEYKYSANLCFDLNNEERLAGFIPNKTTVEILTEYLYGITQNTNVHSRILYGSYGTGKSHLLTVLCALLGKINSKSEGFKTFISSIEKYDRELAKYLLEFRDERKPYMVVPVYSDYHEFDKCISFSLKKELLKNGYEIVFNNYYQEALDLIKNWESGEESSKKLDESLETLDINKRELCQRLENMNDGVEESFDALFKLMTFGAPFVSGAGSLIDNLETANKAISEKYDGIVFVFDEFGRYIEDEGESVRVKSIQDMAEYCDHSEYNDYIILVSHKQLSLYTDRMRKELSDEWKKVEGRFKATSINVKYDQCLSLISHIIPKTKEWEKYEVVFKDELNDLFSKAYDFKGFMLPPDGEKPFEGGFPLHPITLFSLDRLSKRVAHNERTFFTFLASDEENALFWILGKLDVKEFHFVGLDSLFDYFEPNIRSFRSDEVYEIYKKYQYAVNKLGNQSLSSVEMKILKTMAVIGIIADSSVLISDRGMLRYVIDSSDAEIDAAIDNLEKLRIIKYMRQFGYFDFLDSSIFDFESLIADKMKSVSTEMVVTQLNDEFINFVVYPNEYNTQYHMTRLYVPVFVLRQDLGKKSFYKTLPDYYDGTVGMVIDENYEEKAYHEAENCPERMILLVNSRPSEIINEVKRFIAIKYFYAKRKELSKEDPTAERELTLYLEEQREIVKEIIKNWRTLKNKAISLFTNGEKKLVRTEKELSFLASEIMFESFPDTLIVNNDLINKNNISGTINRSKNKVISNLIDQEDIRVGFAIMSPEHTIIRSVLIRNGFAGDLETYTPNITPHGEHQGEVSGKCVKKEIDKYLKKCEKAQRPISEIYEILKQKPYGLRDGYISILLAFELRGYENVGLYFHGTEKDFDVEEFTKALKDPEDYSLYLCNWTEAQSDYIKEIEDIFGTFVNSGAKNRLKELHKAMNVHYSSIPKIARSTDKYISTKTKRYRDIMSISHKDYYKFFFEDLLEIDSDVESLKYSLKLIKKELEEVTKLQIVEVQKCTKKILGIDSDQQLVPYLIKMVDDSWKAKATKSFDYQTNAFLEYVQTISIDKPDEKCTEDIAKVITGFELDYWSDSTIDEYADILLQIVKKLDDYVPTDELGDNELQIIVKSGKNEEVVSRFDNREISVNGQIMFNKMKNTLDGLGKSISQEEKMVIMARLLAEIN